jgi:hypothetical protein
MRGLLALAAAVGLLAAGAALAQDQNPPPTTGNNGSAPGGESIESTPGVAFYVFVLLIGAALVAVLLFVTGRQDRWKRRP